MLGAFRVRVAQSVNTLLPIIKKFPCKNLREAHPYKAPFYNFTGLLKVLWHLTPSTTKFSESFIYSRFSKCYKSK